MTNNTNEITIRFNFLNAGSKLKANYKPRTANYTFSGSIVEHENLDVSHNLINSVLASNEAKGGRATLCFQNREEATHYIKMINTVLAVSPEAQIKVLTSTPTSGVSSNNIIYNDNSNKSLTIFNPDIVELDEIRKPVIGGINRRTAPTDETIAFNYEEELDRVAPPNQYGTRNYREIRKLEKALETKVNNVNTRELPVDPLAEVKTELPVVQKEEEVEVSSIDKELIAIVLKQVGPIEFARMSKEEQTSLIEGLKLCV